jgi:hypothetical protein
MHLNGLRPIELMQINDGRFDPIIDAVAGVLPK